MVGISQTIWPPRGAGGLGEGQGLHLGTPRASAPQTSKSNCTRDAECEVRWGLPCTCAHPARAEDSVWLLTP